MKLRNRNKYDTWLSRNEYFSEITDELDSLAGINVEKSFYHFGHYILADNTCIRNKVLAIRIPGRTVGGIWIDDDNIITKIFVDTEYIIKTYPSDVNKQIGKFVGKTIEFKKCYKPEGDSIMSGWGKRVPGCSSCAHANKEKMKCYPESEDCKSEYDLEETDFNKECNCDFYKKR